MPEKPGRGSSIAMALLSRFLVTGEVAETEWVAPRMRQIRIRGAELAGLRWTPGQHIRLMLRTSLRTYSIWRHETGAESLDLIGYDHGGDGPGTTWVRTVTVGQKIRFTRPEGRLVPDVDARYHLFAGEETASVAFGAMLSAIAESAPVYGVVEADREGDHLDLPRELVRIYRNGASAASSELLVKAVADLDLPDTPGTAYLAGEARTIQAIRRHLVHDRGWNRKDIRTKPFWTPGKRGLD
ncbi:siderophore-interacting protein [Spongiactinospora sp. 9N601]|uniref:siderophore-interacting protein n=1 Tax=Spongiactinospora sp. 9N601 TaxID=3375149 RepID=UPI0037935B78